jgi:hypothetical protein
MYSTSFFLVAVARFEQATSASRGYYCAFLALVLPLRYPFQTGGPFIDRFEYFSLLISGLTNPVFLTYVALVSTGRNGRAVRALRIILPLMLPFCWVVFHYQDFWPREGYFLWIFGMLVVLLSDWLENTEEILLTRKSR